MPLNNETKQFNPKLLVDWCVYTFPNGITTRVNVIAWLQFELAN